MNSAPPASAAAVGHHSGQESTAPPADLVQHVVASTGLPATTAARVVSDVIGYFAETTEQFVRRRHAELHRNLKNDQIWAVISAELAGRPVAAPPLSGRQLRRMVYG